MRRRPGNRAWRFLLATCCLDGDLYESGGLIDMVTDRQILAAYRMLAAKEAVFGELASAAGVAGLIQACENKQLDAGSRVVCTITGNGLKDPDWAVSAAPAPVTVRADPAAAAAALGLA